MNNSNFNKDYFSNIDVQKRKETLEYYFRLIEKFVPKKSINFLDIGTATGETLLIAKNKGFNFFGIDISEFAIEKTKKKLKSQEREKIFIQNIEEKTQFKDNYFDIIFMLDVIEHFKNPFKALKEVYRILKPEGIFLLTTPNSNALAKFFLRNKWYGLKDKTHFFFFSQFSLQYLLRKIGFNIKYWRNISESKYPFIDLFINLFNFGGQIIIIAKK